MRRGSQAVKDMKRLTDEEYKFIFERAPRLCLDFIIIKDGKFLLTRRDIEPFKGFWHLPGGMIRRGEKINEAAERILSSELGASFDSIEMAGYIDCGFETNQNGIEIHSISIVFLTKFNDDKLKSVLSEKAVLFGDVPEKTQPVHAEFIKNNLSKIRN